MEITTKFNLNDIVYPIEICENSYIYGICPSCSGSGVVTIKSGVNQSIKQLSCSNCVGVGEIKKEKWVNYIGKERIVKEIVIKSSAIIGTTSIRYLLNFSHSDLYREEDIFTSSEEAQKECDRRNK